MDLVTGAVTGALGSLICKLGELLKDEYKLQKGMKDQVKYLTRELQSAHAALRKVAEVPSDQVDELVKIWARQVREASYDMEDILDTFLAHMEGGGKPAEQESWLKRLAEKVTNMFKNIKDRRKIDGAIEEIKKHLDEVMDRRERYTVDSSIVAKPASLRTVDPRLAAMYKEASQLIGLDKSGGNLISMLSLPEGDDAKSNKKMKIVSVVGVGGLGKTTLAKAVYDEFKDMFHCGAFIPVGQNPDLKKVLRDVLIGLNKEKYRPTEFTTLDVGQLTDEIRDFLGGKRYFIVIDDVWEKQSWETIKLALVENNRGSRIITTSRNLEVCSTGEVYKLQPLSDVNSKKLFYTRLYGGEDKCSNNQSSDEVDEASNKILKKCGGVPLAIITMASLLVGKSREYWLEVCNSIGFHDKDKQQVGDTMWIFSLSYYDLPPHLKTCLLYLSAFPEDYFIHKDLLIWTRIAEGFVQKKPGFGLFEVGEEYFNSLINRSMIQAEDEDGVIYGCRVHDMVLDLIHSFSQEENFVTVLDNDKVRLSGSKARRLVLQKKTMDHTPPRDKKHMDVQQQTRYIDRLEHLGSLLHLRCLVLRNTDIDVLPEEIGALKFLQVLYLDGTQIRELPSSVALLTRLVCLRAPEVIAPDRIIRKLTSLEELQIHAGQDDHSERQFAKDVGCLRDLRILRTNISWEVSDLWKSLRNLHDMQHLTLEGRCFGAYSGDEATKWTSVALPRHLQHLAIRSSLLAGLPPCIHPSIVTNLSHLDLYVIDMDDQGLKTLGGLLELRYLKLQKRSTATLTITPADGCFQKLTSFLLPYSTVQFVLHEDSSDVSFTIWNGLHTMTIGCKRGDECRVAPAVMPNLQRLEFQVTVTALLHNKLSCHTLGLEYLPSLQKVKVVFHCVDAFEDDVEEEEAALRHAIKVHPNKHKLDVSVSKYGMKRQSTDDDVSSEEDEEEDKVSSASCSGAMEYDEEEDEVSMSHHQRTGGRR